MNHEPPRPVIDGGESLSAICYHKELPVPANTSETTVGAKPTYRCQVSIGILPAAFHLTLFPLDTKAGLNLVNKTLVSQTCEHRIQRGSLPKLGTATKQPLHDKGNLLFYVRSEFFSVRVYFVLVCDLATKMLLGTSFIDGFICGVFLSISKAVPWHSHLLAVLFNGLL